MAITRSLLRASIFNDVYDCINTKVTDPLDRDKQWIFSNFPDTKTNFVGYPLIVIRKAIIDKDYKLLDNGWSDVKVSINITIYSTNNSYVDTLSDSIDAVMTDTNLPKFNFLDYSETPGDVPIDGSNIHFRTMTYFIEVTKL